VKFTVTEHARKRCARRGIDLQMISEAIQNPRETFPDLVDPDATHVRYDVPQRGFRTLRVVVNYSVDLLRIITAFFEG
jgi:hypothetical protein